MLLDPEHVEQLDTEELRALKALERGDATEYEQRLALSVVIHKLSRAYRQTWVQGQPDSTSFLAGRAFVGQQLAKLLGIPVEQAPRGDQ